MQKQVIVTGGAGFIGHHLIKKLISKNYYPIIIDNFFNANFLNLKSLPANKYSLIKLDITNPNIENELKAFKPKVIVHLAALHYIPYCISHPQDTINVNIQGTKNILKIANKLNIKKFVFSSSAAIYKPNNEPHKENDAVGPIDIYGQTKMKAEKIIKNFCTKNKIQFYILRFFNVYGKGNLTPHLIPSLLKKIKKSNTIRIGNLDTYRDYIYVDDVIDAILKIIEKESKINEHIFNIGTGSGHSGKDILSIIESILNKTIKFVKDKNLMRKNDRKHLIANTNKMKKYYNWQSTISLENGLKEVIENE
jgi:UDP-glucose 4-epimerase